MDSCVLAETSEQYSQALGFCQQAIDLLKNAMRMQNLSQSLYTMAQKKSNSCVIKFRSLQKRLMLRQESNHSTNSSDSGIVQDLRYEIYTYIHGVSSCNVIDLIIFLYIIPSNLLVCIVLHWIIYAGQCNNWTITVICCYLW